MTQPSSLDELLTSFFKNELPNPWPSFEAPASEVRADLPVPASLAQAMTESRTDTSYKSRLALALSAALILGGCWYLSGYVHHTPNAKPGVTIDNGSASSDVLTNVGKSDKKAHSDILPKLP